MNRLLKWGMGWLLGVFVGNLVWLFGLESPAAQFFTAEWWQLWSVAYGLGIAAMALGVFRTVRAGHRHHESPR